MTEDARVSEIQAWFDERGYDLVISAVPHGFYALWIPKNSTQGNAPFAYGRTKLEAAKAGYEVQKP